MTRKIFILACALCISACSTHNIQKNTKGIGVERPSFDIPSIHFPSISIEPSKTVLPNLSSSSIPPELSSVTQSSSAPISSSSNPNPGTDYFYTDQYGPFQLGANDFNATFTYELYTISSQQILERIRLFNASNSVVASSTKNKINYVSGTRNSVTFLVPIHDYWTNNGLTLKFEILNYSTREILKQYSATFYPPSNQTVSGEILKRNYYQSRALGFYGDGQGMKEIVEVFDFRYLGEYLNNANYYRLDLSKNAFVYPYSYNFWFNSINIRFNDSEYLFPYYSHNNNDEIVIPLTLNRAGPYIWFSYAKNFYINKRTLQISDSYHQDFVITSDFYLPINGHSVFNEKRLYFDINHLGLDGISTSISLKYDTNKALVSVCTDGEYCIEGGNK